MTKKPPGTSSEDRLRIAIRSGDLEGVESALAAGVSVEHRFPGGLTPLMVAVNEDQAGVVRYLLHRGADVHAVLPFGQLAALHSAAEGGNVEIARALLEGGAAPDTPSAVGTPLVLACRYGHLNVAMLLLERGTPPSHHVLQSAIGAALSGLHRDVADYLLEQGADIDRLDENGATRLHTACYWKAEEVVEYLLSRGARPDLADAAGFTPLDMAELDIDDLDRGHWGPEEYEGCKARIVAALNRARSGS